MRYDGVECVFHFIKLRLRPGDTPYMVILTNIPQATALAKAEAAFTLNLCLLAVAAILALVIARFLGKAIVGRHVETLKESEERFRNLFENAPLAYQSLDENGQFLDVNRKWLESLGYKDKAQVLGRWFGDILAPGYREHFDFNFPMFKHACVIDGVEFEMLRTDGGRITVSFNGRVQTDREGHFMRTHCIFTDITERKRAEDALRESEARFRTLFDKISSVAVQGYDQNRTVVYWNEASTRFYGYSREEAAGRKLEDLIIPPNMRSMVIECIRAWVEEDIAIPAGEIDLMRKDCSTLAVFSSHIMQRFHDGTSIMYCLDIDLSELSEARVELVKAKENAEAANKAKSEFLANMSHEIRTPLNGILGMLQLLKTTDPNEEQQEYLVGAIRSTSRLTRLLSDILDISKIEAGRMKIVETEFDIKNMRDSIYELFDMEARGKGLLLEFGWNENIPPLLIGDEARLRQILFNLVGNAIKFTERGEVRIDVSLLVSLGDSSARVLVTVSDTGIGISEECIKSVFEPFVQAEGTYTRRFQGAGLGLSIVRRLVKLLGGDVAIESTLGEGTTIYVSLPFKLPSGGQGQIDQEVRVIAPVAETSWRILLAEDDTISLITAKRMLEKSGYSVTAAKNGQEALQRLAEEDFDLILMDVQMPVMDGVEATKAIRGASNLGAKSSVPIVAMTAYAMTGDKEIFLAAGMDDYISKPVDKAALVDVIERVLSLKRNIQ